MSETPERKVYRRPPSWQIRAADGTLRRVGGDGPTWWDDARSVEPTLAPIYGADCSPDPGWVLARHPA